LTLIRVPITVVPQSRNLRAAGGRAC